MNDSLTPADRIADVTTVASCAAVLANVESIMLIFSLFTAGVYYMVRTYMVLKHGPDDHSR